MTILQKHSDIWRRACGSLLIVVGLGVLLPTQATAQQSHTATRQAEEAFGPDRDTLIACLRSGGDGIAVAANAVACEGVIADPCIDALAENYSTFAENQCLARELDAWDWILNRVYAYDPATREGVGGRAVQRHWLAYQRGHCAAVDSMQDGGSLRMIVWPRCMIETTAFRVGQLLRLRDGGDRLGE